MMYLCPVCGRSYRSLVSLKYHFRRIHLPNFNRCPICGKRRRDPIRLPHHCFMALREGYDEEHMIYYYLSSGCSTVNNRARLVEARKIAAQALRR
ncbi:MAG: C2H2-type zinc finger protein [Candidatus Nezhaarchaeales archaeon]